MFYNLDAVISVEYRVNSKKATQFRKWATKTLQEFILKGFVLNDKMLKSGRAFGKDYFDELLERIREIRASEKRAYQKIADIFEQCSSDYNKNAEETRLFYKIVQNKMHFAITGQTAAEIIYNRADSEIPENAGAISHELAMAKAEEEYEKFRVKQDREYISQFDGELAKYLKGDMGDK
jgi:hypothetical protein